MKKGLKAFAVVAALTLVAGVAALGANANITKSGYPIVKNKVTLRVLIPNSPDAPKDINEIEIIKKAEKATNVHIQWIMPGSGFNDKKSLMLASGDLPDVIISGVTDAELVKYGKNGVFLPLEGLINKYAPNLKQIFKEKPYVKAFATAPDGHIYATPRVNEGPWMRREGMGVGMINTAWLKKLGLKMPTALDEFEKVMLAFKTQDPNGNGKADEIPMTGVGNGAGGFQTMHGFGYLFDSFGLASNWKYQIVNNGKVEFIGTLPNYKAAIKWFHELYSEGLIDIESFTQAYEKKAAKLNAQPYIVGYADVWDINDDFTTKDAHENYDYMPPLKGLNGENPRMYWAALPGYDRLGAVITRACKEPEIAIRYIDYIYDTKNSMEWIEGEFGGRLKQAPEGYYYIPDPPAGMTQQQWRAKNCPGHSACWAVFEPSYRKVLRLVYTDQKVEFMDKFILPLADKTPCPPLFYNASEADEYNQINTAIIAYADRKAAQWIMKGNIDNEWDGYLKELKKMKLDKWLKINQAAYNRYLKGSK